MSREAPWKFERVRVQHEGGGASRTKQSDAEDANINVVLERWMKKGIPPKICGTLRYGDFRNVDDYQTCMMRVQQAQEDFMNLPAKVRDACRNDVGEFVEKALDPDGRVELMKLGMEEGHRQVDDQGELVDDQVVEAAETPPEAPEEGATDSSVT